MPYLYSLSVKNDTLCWKILIILKTFNFNSHQLIKTDLRHRPPSPEVSPEPSLLPRLLLSLTSLFFLTLLLVFTLRSQLPPVVPALLVVVGPAVGGVLGTLNRLPVWTRHVRSLWHVLCENMSFILVDFVQI